MCILTKTFPETGFASVCRRFAPAWWWGFGLSLGLPLAVLAFLGSGPHPAWAALLWTTPVWILIAADRWGMRDELRQVPPGAPRGFFDGLLWVLAGLQVLNVLAMGLMVSRLAWTSGSEIAASLVNLLALRILAGTNSCCAAIAPAHELIHRRRRGERLLGRLLLVTVGYDHFFIAHRHGHHARLGTSEDPSTARLDESYESFFRNSLVRQWQVAWQRKPKAVIQGVAAELALLGGLGWAFGALAALVWLYQALVAIRILEAVNYVQHFGLVGESGRPAVAWRCDSALSLFLFLGLTRHSDHHRRPGVPYPRLSVLENGPRLPYGYLRMVLWVKNGNRSYRRWAAGRLALFAAGPKPSLENVNLRDVPAPAPSAAAITRVE